MARVTIVVLSSVLVINLLACAFALRCYQCAYTNRPVPASARILDLVPTAACLTLNPRTDDPNVQINETCSRGCKSTRYTDTDGMTLVLRGCMHRTENVCANYTTENMTVECCEGPLCNAGPIEQELAGAVKCYQCIGSTSPDDQSGINKYADKEMQITDDCLDPTFNSRGRYVEVNTTCAGGCLTGVITDVDGMMYVSRGCAAPNGKYPCVSGTLTGAAIKNPQVHSVSQACCMTDYCNAGTDRSAVAPPTASTGTTTTSAHTLSSTSTSTFQEKNNITVFSNEKETEKNSNGKKAEKAYTVIALANRTYSINLLLVLTLTFVLYIT